MSWPADKAACYGVNCPHHLSCARYRAVEGNTNERQVFIAMCGPTLPLFMSVLPAVQDARVVLRKATA